MYIFHQNATPLYSSLMHAALLEEPQASEDVHGLKTSSPSDIYHEITVGMNSERGLKILAHLAGCTKLRAHLQRCPACSCSTAQKILGKAFFYQPAEIRRKLLCNGAPHDRDLTSHFLLDRDCIRHGAYSLVRPSSTYQFHPNVQPSLEFGSTQVSQGISLLGGYPAIFSVVLAYCFPWARSGNAMQGAVVVAMAISSAGSMCASPSWLSAGLCVNSIAPCAYVMGACSVFC